MGDGVAILPAADEVYAPCDGVISMVHKNKHAIGITNAQGAEILLHMGIDTVCLDPSYFTAFVQPGERVRQGQKLVAFHRENIITAGYDTTILMIITNMTAFQECRAHAGGTLHHGEPVMEIK